MSLTALAGEYPGTSAAGRHVALDDVLPLALLAWVHLAMLDGHEREARWWAVAAALGDAALLATAVLQTLHGGPAIAYALLVIAAVLLACTILLQLFRVPSRAGR